MDRDVIVELCTAGEGQSLEYKANYTSEIGRSICAFANTNGGTILVGVADNGTVKGVSATVEERVASLAQSCQPPVHPLVNSLDVDGRRVVAIDVQHGDEQFHAFRNVVYRRVGSTDAPVSPKQILEVAAAQKGSRFGSMVRSGATLSDIDEDALQAFLDLAGAGHRLPVEGQMTAEQALRKLDLLANEGLTNAALLLFGREPQHGCIQSEVRCARFKGNQPGTFTDMKVIAGTLASQIDEVERFVMNNTALRAEIRDFERVEKWEYPLSAVREAVTNAVCHRDYTSTANVQLSVFDDRLEVWNPGGLPEDLTVDDLRRSHPSKPRNPLVANALFLIKYIERWGTGTQRIVREVVDHGLPDPEFVERQGGFAVVFRKTSAVMSSLNPRQRAAWAYLREYDGISRKEYAMQFECSARTAARDLNALVDSGLVVRRGAGRATSYARHA